MDVIPASSVTGDAGYGFQGHGVTQDKILEPSIQREVRKHGLYRECVYQLGGGLAIAHLISNNVINRAPGGPDDLFEQLQTQDLGLERLPMKQSVGQCSQYDIVNNWLISKQWNKRIRGISVTTS